MRRSSLYGACTTLFLTCRAGSFRLACAPMILRWILLGALRGMHQRHERTRARSIGEARRDGLRLQRPADPRAAVQLHTRATARPAPRFASTRRASCARRLAQNIDDLDRAAHDATSNTRISCRQRGSRRPHRIPTTTSLLKQAVARVGGWLRACGRRDLRGHERSAVHGDPRLARGDGCMRATEPCSRLRGLCCAGVRRRRPVRSRSGDVRRRRRDRVRRRAAVDVAYLRGLPHERAGADLDRSRSGSPRAVHDRLPAEHAVPPARRDAERARGARVQGERRQLRRYDARRRTCHATSTASALEIDDASGTPRGSYAYVSNGACATAARRRSAPTRTSSNDGTRRDVQRRALGHDVVGRVLDRARRGHRHVDRVRRGRRRQRRRRDGELSERHDRRRRRGGQVPIAEAGARATDGRKAAVATRPATRACSPRVLVAVRVVALPPASHRRRLLAFALACSPAAASTCGRASARRSPSAR